MVQSSKNCTIYFLVKNTLCSRLLVFASHYSYRKNLRYVLSIFLTFLSYYFYMKLPSSKFLWFVLIFLALRLYFSLGIIDLLVLLHFLSDLSYFLLVDLVVYELLEKLFFIETKFNSLIVIKTCDTRVNLLTWIYYNYEELKIFPEKFSTALLCPSK